MSQTRLSETSGINQVTLANLKNGKASRITDKVWSRLVAAYDGIAPMPGEPTKKRRLQKKKPVIVVEKKGISPQPEPPMVKAINDVIQQLEDLKKQIKPLEELRALLMKMN